MKRIALAVCLAVAGIGLLAVIAAAVLTRVVLTPERLEHNLSARLGRDVTIGGTVEASFWSDARLTASKVEIMNPPGSAFRHLVILDSISVGLRWWDLPVLLFNSHPHFLDVQASGGKVHVDGRQDVVGADGVWPSADDPFTSALGWVHRLKAKDLRLEIQADQERLREIDVASLEVFFETGEADAVIIDARKLDLSLSGVPLEGSLSLNAPIVSPKSAPPASLSGALKVAKVDFGKMMTSPGSAGSSFASAQALPVHTCNSWDTDIEVSAEGVGVGDTQITDINFRVRSTGGHWRVVLANAKFPAGDGTGEMSLRCGSLPGEFELSSHVASKGMSRFGQSGATVKVLGRMESMLKLMGKGTTWKELIGDLDGRFALFLGPVQTQKLEDRFYAKGLFHALTVSWGQSEKANVDCGVIDMQIKDGVAHTQQLVVATPTLVIDGYGKVELVEDVVEIVLIPRAKHPRLGKVQVPVLLSGKLEKPHLGLDWERVLQRLGIETATAMVQPVLDLLPFDGLAEEERAACRRSLEPLQLSGETKAG